MPILRRECRARIGLNYAEVRVRCSPGIDRVGEYGIVSVSTAGYVTFDGDSRKHPELYAGVSTEYVLLYAGGECIISCVKCVQATPRQLTVYTPDPGSRKHEHERQQA